MPRLFTGLEIPSQTGLMLSLLRGGLRGARWIDPENYHITLRFIGDVDDRMADEIADTLDRVRRAPVQVRITGLGAFANGKPHAVFARVEPASDLVEMQGEQERMMQRLRLQPERRKYVPHVTLARCRSSSNEDVARWLAEHGGFQELTFTANRFVLLSSKDSVGGGPYLVEEAYPLDQGRGSGGYAQVDGLVAPSDRW
ncbi:MAG: RNA 2',3'-cyclic phosphodiesterase [Stappia sp.]|uniref:RNA 2',3'-cyclic phosphodiesterase n=1 Tax=Stappia sp. TaxID=1870903 RepID=UPI000C51F386|nr:RNA 2',3'-cyclic phosphodiesterase [Stappia sp.]MAA98505.1 RNA 2',3'-cyclic phosphodiesterase [Stappia sp.]MBM21345.1 RNA 2',3'-cyclic phosphodiesterase [Stappia sp.]|tara:strand:- start:553 stop:1149 length:597 start_codon:yes stop_codon:yes gene_type:complete